MISGASEKELIEAIGRTDVLLEFMPKIKQLQQENKQLKDNWNELKEYCLDEQIPEEYDEYNSYIEFSNSVYDNILNKMQELEQGSDSNEQNKNK